MKREDVETAIEYLPRPRPGGPHPGSGKPAILRVFYLGTDRLRGARQRMKAKTGSCEGRKPYGFYDGESDALQRMGALRATGLGYDRIAEVLNAEGLKP